MGRPRLGVASVAEKQSISINLSRIVVELYLLIIRSLLGTLTGCYLTGGGGGALVPLLLASLPKQIQTNLLPISCLNAPQQPLKRRHQSPAAIVFVRICVDKHGAAVAAAAAAATVAYRLKFRRLCAPDFALPVAAASAVALLADSAAANNQSFIYLSAFYRYHPPATLLAPLHQPASQPAS